MSRASTWKPSISCSPGLRLSNRQAPRSSLGVMGKWGGDMARPSTDAMSVSVPWCGPYRVTSGSGLSPARKKGRPWVWSQCRWPEQDAALKAAVEEVAEPPDAGAGVDHQPWGGLAVAGTGPGWKYGPRSGGNRPRGPAWSRGPPRQDFHPSILPGCAAAPVFLGDEGDLAPGMARGQRPVGGGRFRQRVGGGDHDLEPALLGQAQQVRPGRRP